MGLIWEIIKELAKDENNKSKDNSELEDWQKELVDKEENDSFNFEEEELEEDDYYYEDDK